MYFKIDNALLSVIVLSQQFYALYLLFVGLIGEKSVSSLHKSSINASLVPFSGSSHGVDKIVLIIIDALRLDFISHTYTPYISKSIDAKIGCAFRTNVKPPTVTLPRIKSIVTGAVSNYWDVIENFQSVELKTDNFIWHAVSDSSKKITFFGDETWLKLFPSSFSPLSSGVSSFYVSDFYEVDLNVTQKLNNLLKYQNNGNNWDMLILHYLGLDHIGHVHGPKSPLIGPKMKEMDHVVEKLMEFLVKLDSESLIFICGDHGMANVGGHGGTSYHETSTPLIVLSSKNKYKNCWEPDEWSSLDSSSVPKIEQTDIAPTISSLWNLELPSQSIGKIIHPLLQHTSSKHRIYYSLNNAHHLSQFIKNMSYQQEVKDILKSYADEFRLSLDTSHEENIDFLNLENSIKSTLDEISEVISQTSSSHDLTLIFSAILLSIQNLLLINSSITLTTSHILITITSLILLYFLKLSIISYGIYLIFLNIMIIVKSTSFKKIQLKIISLDFLQILHYLLPITYFSSSFVEEEHLVRYYLWTLIIVFQIFAVANEAIVTMKYVFKIFLLMFLHRVSCSWNQTGQKWSDLPDLVDFLNEGKFMSSGVIFSLLGIIYLRREKFSPMIIFFIKITLILLLKAKFDSLKNYEQFFGQSVYMLLVLYIIYMACKKSSNFFEVSTNCFIILSLLLHRYENIPLVFLTLFQVEIFCHIQIDLKQNWKQVKKSKPKSEEIKFHKAEHQVIFLLWFMSAAFFYQGNSNSIASIDVNSGYVGLGSYNEAFVGFQIFLNTFSLLFLILFAYFETLRTPEMENFFCSTVAKSCVGLGLIYSICIFIFRDHLFIWSVFTPKLLYVILFNLFYCLVVLILFFSTYVK